MGRTFYETHAFINIFYIVVRFEVMLDDGTLAFIKLNLVYPLRHQYRHLIFFYFP